MPTYCYCIKLCHALVLVPWPGLRIFMLICFFCLKTSGRIGNLSLHTYIEFQKWCMWMTEWSKSHNHASPLYQVEWAKLYIQLHPIYFFDFIWHLLYTLKLMNSYKLRLNIIIVWQNHGFWRDLIFLQILLYIVVLQLGMRGQLTCYSFEVQFDSFDVISWRTNLYIYWLLKLNFLNF